MKNNKIIFMLVLLFSHVPVLSMANEIWQPSASQLSPEITSSNSRVLSMKASGVILENGQASDVACEIGISSSGSSTADFLLVSAGFDRKFDGKYSSVAFRKITKAGIASKVSDIQKQVIKDGEYLYSGTEKVADQFHVSERMSQELKEDMSIFNYYNLGNWVNRESADLIFACEKDQDCVAVFKNSAQKVLAVSVGDLICLLKSNFTKNN